MTASDYVIQHNRLPSHISLVSLRSNLINQSMEIKTERQKLNRIKAVLAETGHTGKWLAEQLGKDPVTVSKWCTNTSQPDLYTLQEISSLLSMDIRRLIVSTEGSY